MALTQAEALFDPHVEGSTSARRRPCGQVLKWVGNKFRYAELIAGHLPTPLGTYYEPFVGTGAVLATLAPERAVAGDALKELVELHQTLQTDPQSLVDHYARCRERLMDRGRVAYEEIKASYNTQPNPHDLLVVSRTCYGGVMRFTKDGYISTPMGPHRPMPVEKVSRNIADWHERLVGTEFLYQDFAVTMAAAGDGDTVYCDPPYAHGQSILYGAQAFKADRLWAAVAAAVDRGARVAVSFDGFRQSGDKHIAVEEIAGLFPRELLVDRGGCMLRRFQLGGQDMSQERVADRLLLSW